MGREMLSESSGGRRYQEKAGSGDSWQGRGLGISMRLQPHVQGTGAHQRCGEVREEGLGSPGKPPPPCGKGVWCRAREDRGAGRRGSPSGVGQRAGGAEEEPGRRWAWRGRAGRRRLRAALGPAGRPSGSREVDKAAAAFDVSGELILNRYKMAEGDEAARRQQPHHGLRRRRQTSDASVGVNHVSSTTSLGTGRPTGPRPRGLRVGRAAAARAGEPRPPGGVQVSGWLGSLGSRRRGRSQGLASAAPRAPPRGLRGRPAGLSSHSWRVNGRAGGPAPCPPPPPPRGCRRVRPDPRGRPRAGAAGPGRAPRSAAVRARALAAFGASRGPGREGERDAPGPAAVAVAVAADAGTAGTWLPGRRARHTHPSRWEPQSAGPGCGPGCGPGSGSRALRSARPIRRSCAWLGFRVLA